MSPDVATKLSSLVRCCAGALAFLLLAPAPAVADVGEVVATAADQAAAYKSREQALATAHSLEQAAARSQKPQRAIELLERAYAVRVYTGPKRQALQDIKKIERLYAGISSERAADAFWRRRALLTANGNTQARALRRHAVAYLARYGEVGGLDRAIVASLEIAEYNWNRSCPGGGLLELCIAWEQQPNKAGEAVHSRYLTGILPRIDEALQAKLREQLTPVVIARLKKPRTIWPEPRRSTINRVRGTLAGGRAGDTQPVYIPPALLQQAVAREVRRALPEARARVLARVGVGSRKKPQYCTDVYGLTRQTITVRPRNRALVKSVYQQLERVEQLAKRLKNRELQGLTAERRGAVGEALAKLARYRADAEFEQLLRERVPSGLQFHYDDWKKDSGLPQWEMEYKNQILAGERSLMRLADYQSRVLKASSELSQKYGDIAADRHHPEQVLLAASRSAMLSLSLAIRLRGVKIPSRIKQPEHIRMYCERFVEEADPIAKRAVEALTYCVDRATVYQYFTPAARWCEHSLSVHEPQRFPLLREFLGD